MDLLDFYQEVKWASIDENSTLATGAIANSFLQQTRPQGVIFSFLFFQALEPRFSSDALDEGIVQQSLDSSRRRMAER